MKTSKEKSYPNLWRRATDILKKDGIGVLPTDTIYGLVGSAKSKKAVSRIFKIKERDTKKPLIVLTNSLSDLALFGISINKKQAKFLKKIWPGKVSVIFECWNLKLAYLHRGTNSIAFRMISPQYRNLFNLIKEVGPIVAPSANKENCSPAKSTIEAKKYFQKDVDFYISGNIKKSKPSTVVSFNQNKIKIIREGDIKIKDK